MVTTLNPFDTPSDALAHYGVLGMKWGVRKDRPAGVSARTNRDARKDAKEYARAKMFYGEGAGTRRKLINKSVEAKSKRNESYKKAFDFHLEKQDLSKHGDKAVSERRRKDTKNKVAKTARGIKNLAMGTGAPVTLTAVAAYAAYQNPQVQRTVKDAGRTSMRVVKERPNDPAFVNLINRVRLR